MMSMKFLEYNKNSIERRLSYLSAHKQLAFGLMIVERALPYFKSFSQEVSFDDGGALDSIRDYGWSILKGADKTAFGSKALIECDRILERIEAIEVQNVSVAFDVVNICAYMLDFINNLEVNNLGHVSSLSYEMVQMFADKNSNESYYSTEYEGRLKKHRLVQNELRSQEKDLSFLETLHIETDKISEHVERHLNIEIGDKGSN